MSEIMEILYSYRPSTRDGDNCLTCRQCNFYYIGSDNEKRYGCLACVDTRGQSVDGEHICNRYEKKGCWK